MFQKLRKIAFWLILILAITYFVAAYLTKPAQDHPFFSQSNNQTDVIAHRGGHGLWPGNTLYGFKQAVELGADILEMDVHSTKDSILVILHDDSVDRTTNGKGLVRDFTLKELKTLDAGYTWTHDEGKTYPYRNKDITIPTVTEVFNALPNTRMAIEIKQTEPDITTAFGNLIRKHNMTNQVLVASFDSGTLRAFRKQFPEIATSAGFTEGLLYYALSRLHLSDAYRPNTHALQIPKKLGPLNTTHPAFLSAARKHNLKIHYWTVNQPHVMETFIDLGVDGIITIYPDRLIQLLDK
ncbi:MAG: glycerophosphodiester phosphodiesterase [Candidatus Latescibacteria bacterium]|jgi:glycerophosphoryl diester phosphodiesterase|nr:glycerophosphodiester phosphodiesterase [Candidatus Latescibacterota bacterium]MBT4140038.1 glycerophosphodiester phosphodiesterase [Candidatus Latescibacterota bacterium]MBT5831435.1 glycerophosphodiester phosphodiesterase [Candidatus Latescibacterota bacterium]